MGYVGGERKSKKKSRIYYSGGKNVEYEKIIASMTNEKKDKTLMSPVVKSGNKMKEHR